MFSFLSLTLPLYLHLILPIQPFYIFITGVGNAKTIRAISTIGGITGPLREKPQNTHTQKEGEKKNHLTPSLSADLYLLSCCSFYTF